MRTGSYTLGGNGPDALPIARLECCPPVATISIPSEGPATIQRITAAVIVRLDQSPLGISPKTLHDGMEIAFGDCRLTFRTDDGEVALTSGSNGVEPPAWVATATPAARPTDAPESPGKARLVNVYSRESVELSEQRVVIGRDESCDFVIPGMQVSRRHLSITAVQNGYLLRDESANGTVVNGRRVAGTYLLGHGDLLEIGDEELRFEVDGLTLPAANDAAPTALLDLSYVRNAADMNATAEIPPVPTAALQIVRGRFAGASFSIERAVCAIGRGPESDVRIRDESVSTTHATLLRKGSTWFVVDLRSANGTFVDGSRIAGEREIVSGTRLRLGAVELEFRALDATGIPVATKQKGSWLRRAFSALRQAATPPE